MYDALGSGTGVATEMANAINETEPERFERLTQRIQNVKESIGNRQDHAGGGRPGGQLVARVRSGGQRLQPREEDIRALPLH